MSGFGFHTLALLAVIGMAGPLLASLPRFRVPVIIGELVAGLDDGVLVERGRWQYSHYYDPLTP